MRSLAATAATLLGSLTLAVTATPAAAATRPAAKASSRFQTSAGALCQSYFSAVKSKDAEIGDTLGAHPSAAQQVLTTAGLLGTNAELSLATESKLAQLTPPAADRSLWPAMLEADRTGALLTLRTSSVLVKLTSSETAANAVVNLYDSAYTQAESGWNAGVKLLGITGCE